MLPGRSQLGRMSGARTHEPHEPPHWPHGTADAVGAPTGAVGGAVWLRANPPPLSTDRGALLTVNLIAVISRVPAAPATTPALLT